MRLRFPSSHAFHHGRLSIEADADDEGRNGPECLVEFADGIMVVAELNELDEGYRLSVPGYATMRGTQIAARRWRLVRDAKGVWRSQRDG
ncbi:hypothetical protein [Pararhizobium mangrovi]|uniref:Uncharacterized protein n=1 Tax=Pararhizobium mangrovi TaxID=2590452 RepID=A0A506TZ03_9HYPH|nr:hypothetical protein [Pararhizobium mangrovi]TPW25955.1 hypothetical protein FJU11_16925 [Pararhizobium mangrovi]